MGDWYHQSALSSFERLNKLGGLEPTLSHLCFPKFPYLLDLGSVLFCFASLSALHMKLFAGVHLTSTRTLFPFLSCPSLFVERGCGFGPRMCIRISAKAEPVLLPPQLDSFCYWPFILPPRLFFPSRSSGAAPALNPFLVRNTFPRLSQEQSLFFCLRIGSTFVWNFV